MKDRMTISTGKAPKAIGPYSQGIMVGPWLFCAGQLGLDPATGLLAEGGAAAQADRAFLNVRAVVEEAGGNLAQVVRVTLYLKDLADFAAVNEVMGRFFPRDPPARTTVEVARLPKDALVEVEAQVYLG